MSTTTPDWIQVGADVVVYCDDRISPRAGRARIAKINKQTFRVEGSDTLFRIDGQIHRRGTWDAAIHVVPLDSDTGRAKLAEQRRRNRRRRAIQAVDAWQKDQTRATVLAAIEALQNTLVDLPEEG